MVTSTAADDGWAASADAWIKEQSDGGDYARRFVLDGPMVDRIRDRGFRTALDVGCGEGRFCRILRDLGIRAVGVDPTTALLDIARTRDPGGDYRLGRAEALDEFGGHFDLVVSYLSLIDIPDLAAGLRQMVAALRPGGTLLIANLNSFNTAAMPGGWTVDADGSPRFCIDHYLEERAVWVAWRGIRIQNWHRPLSTYMGLLLALGMQLRHFAEPTPTGGDPATGARYRRVPWFHIMEWQKPRLWRHRLRPHGRHHKAGLPGTLTAIRLQRSQRTKRGERLRHDPCRPAVTVQIANHDLVCMTIPRAETLAA